MPAAQSADCVIRKVLSTRHSVILRRPHQHFSLVGVAQAMNDELKRQEHVLDAVTDHTDRTGYEIQHVSAQARKDFKVRPKRAPLTPQTACCQA